MEPIGGYCAESANRYVTIAEAAIHLRIPERTLRSRIRFCRQREFPQPFAKRPGHLIGRSPRRTLLIARLDALGEWAKTYA